VSDQDFLFSTQDTVVADDVARSELRLVALNVQSPSAARARTQLGWLYDTEANIQVLTEVKLGDGATLLRKELESSGFTVHLPTVRDGDRYVTMVATKGFTVSAAGLPDVTSRLSAVRLDTHLGPLDLVGLYSLTNGLTSDSSRERSLFQTQVTDLLTGRAAGHGQVPVLLCGDLNILEPGDTSAHHLFAAHDFTFYGAFAKLGMADVYRHTQPDGTDMSWFGRDGGQRLDHVFLTRGLLGGVADCWFDHSSRTSKLSDHSALRLTLR
jgi:exonuclease III